MGEVYRAHDARLGREVAIKLLPEGVADDADRLGRFEREARVLASLNHPNIAHIYGLEVPEREDGERGSFIVMELVEGDTLADKIRLKPQPGALPLSETLAIARQVA